MVAILLSTTFFAPTALHAQGSIALDIPPISALQPHSDAPAPGSTDEIGFAADAVNYDQDTQVVTATGGVQLRRDGNTLRADKIVWNRATGQVEASGNVSAIDQEGNIAYGDKIDVTDSLKDGLVYNLLLVMEEGGRLAAANGKRTDGIYTLDHAAYSPCAVENSEHCPKNPSWQINAVKVIYDPNRQRVSYRNAQLKLFGFPLVTLPVFSHPVGQSGGTGFLVPDIRINGVNGLEIAPPFFLKFSSSNDLTLTPHIYTNAAPMLESTYRAFTGRGAYRITNYLTYSRKISASSGIAQRDFRGYLDASGKFQLSPSWSISNSIRLASDRTFLRRYYISYDDRLRSTVQAERIKTNSYLSIAGWAIQTMRTSDRQGQMPVALPVIDYRLRLDDPVLGGRVQLQANTMAITRTSGQDTQRAFVGAEWNLRRLTDMGQEVTLTAYGRGDIYHSDSSLLTPTIGYRGKDGWQQRAIVAAAADMRWPFIGPAFNGTQRITPRLQIVAAPKLSNLSIPNEDSRSVELEDSNLFALNRFPGYDRFEDSTRLTYGMEYALTLPDFTLSSIIGQSYRLNQRATLLPDGTGLSSRLSDFVGRSTLRYRDLVSLTHRFRLDKDNLAIRRNELEATVGTKQTYATVSYLHLNRNITAGLEDLQDHEEVRVGVRAQIAKFWSIFGFTAFDLTTKKDNPKSLSDGFETVRHRAGIDYRDDCLNISLTWRREYLAVGDARANNSFQLRLAFRNLGI